MALANVVFTVWLGASMRTLGETTPLPPAQVALLATGRGGGCRVGAAAGLRRSWRGASAGGAAAAGSSYTLLAACGVVFAAWLNTWKLLGFHY